MALRVTVTEAVDLTTIRVDGRLANAGVAELEGVCRRARRPVVLDLTNLTGGSDAGLSLLCRLTSEGVHLIGGSPYITLLLASVRPGPPPAPPRRRGRARGGGGE